MNSHRGFLEIVADLVFAAPFAGVGWIINRASPLLGILVLVLILSGLVFVRHKYELGRLGRVVWAIESPVWHTRVLLLTCVVSLFIGKYLSFFLFVSQILFSLWFVAGIVYRSTGFSVRPAGRFRGFVNLFLLMVVLTAICGAQLGEAGVIYSFSWVFFVICAIGGGFFALCILLGRLLLHVADRAL